MRKIARFILIGILILGVVYLLGPRVERPDLTFVLPEAPKDLNALHEWVTEKEQAFSNIKPNNASQIIFYDSIPQKTQYSVLYLHGFSASSAEGDPVHKQIAQHFKANLYLPRLFGHGLAETEPMLDFTANAYWKSALEALAIAKHLGEKVIVLATSNGGTLALNLGHDPDIVALALYSPNIAIYDPSAKLLSKPWGLQLARMAKGSKYHKFDDPKELQKQYWTTHYRMEALTHVQRLIDVSMKTATFKKIDIPVFMGYYYQNDSLQDKVVSVPAMLKMFDELGTSDSLKVKQAFPKAENHVITSYISTPIHEEVGQATIDFLERVLE